MYINFFLTANTVQYYIKLLTFSKRHCSVTIPSLKRITISNALAVDSFFFSIVVLRASTLKIKNKMPVKN